MIKCLKLTVILFKEMYLSVELGEYKCSNRVHQGKNDHTICAIKDSDGNQAMPPVEITVDFGDGSGEQVSCYFLIPLEIINILNLFIRNGPEKNQETCGPTDSNYLEHIGFMFPVRYFIYCGFLKLKDCTFN